MNKLSFIRLLSVLLCLALLTAGLASAAAEAGDSIPDLKALYEEGKDCWFGINGKEYNREAAIDCFRRAADAGYADAWYYLGNAALTGTDPDRYKTAMEYYQKAEELGSLLALYGEARLYQYGRGTEVDREKAKALYEEAIAGGCVEANEGLSALLLDAGDGQAAIQYAEKALEGNDIQLVCRAMINIGKAYKDGIGVEKDLEKTLEWYKKAADAGYNAGYGNVGWQYYYGQGVEQSDAEALAWFEKAAEKGYTHELAWCYLNGKLVEQDYAKALELYLRALDSSVVSLGSGSNTAFINIGWMYQEGKGVEQDYAAALDWYLNGVEDGDPDCMNAAAALYRDGKGTEKDPDRALELYEQAAKNNSASAYGNLGDLYVEGKEVPQDYQKAIGYYEKGIELGSVYCYGQLGWLYAYGMKDAKDYEKAKGYYEKGAELDDPYCNERLGFFFKDGLGVEVDPEKAVDYFRIAIEKGQEQNNQETIKRCVNALKKLGRIVTRLEPSEKQITLLTGGPAEAAEARLSCTVTPAEALWQDVTWASSDESIVTVDESGAVRAVAAGKATVTAETTQPLATAKATAVKVMVNQAVTCIELDSSAVTVPVKKNATVKATVTPAEAANKKLEWTSENEEIAAVQANGRITGKSPGTVTVTAKATDGSGITASLQVTVVQPVKKIDVKEKNVSLDAGTVLPLTYQVLPEDATDRTILWASDNEAVATVDESGKITAAGTGKCTVTGTANDGSGVKIQIRVTVK